MTYAVCILAGLFFAVAVPLSIYQWLKHKWRTAPRMTPQDFARYRMKILTNEELKRVNDYYQRKLNDGDCDVPLRPPRVPVLRGESSLPKTRK